MKGLTDKVKEKVYREFSKRVNMPPKQLQRWLRTKASRAVGAKGKGGGESTGHASGRRIVTIQRKKKDKLTASDYRHMKKVIGYIKRHRAQRPKGSVKESPWRHSLMNWGHDPLQGSSSRRRRSKGHK